MQFLAVLHVVFTCSLVFLLAYLLSRVFTYVAHSVIHGSRTRGAEGSSRGRRSRSLKAQQLLQDDDVGYRRTAVMARLQEEEEEEEDEDDDSELEKEHDAQMGPPAAHASPFDMGGGIFDDLSAEEYDLSRDDDINKEGIMGLDARDTGNSEIVELEYSGISVGKGMQKSEDAEKESTEEKGGARDESVLADTQGSGSLRQRLPPTWSDLERMVNTSSKKERVVPSVSLLPEYED